MRHQSSQGVAVNQTLSDLMVPANSPDSMRSLNDIYFTELQAAAENDGLILCVGVSALGSLHVSRNCPNTGNLLELRSVLSTEEYRAVHQLRICDEAGAIRAIIESTSSPCPREVDFVEAEQIIHGRISAVRRFGQLMIEQSAAPELLQIFTALDPLMQCCTQGGEFRIVSFCSGQDEEQGVSSLVLQYGEQGLSIERRSLRIGEGLWECQTGLCRDSAGVNERGTELLADALSVSLDRLVGNAP
ncbi:MAG: hypothetical protein EBZ48_06360 [Proteobacteria bacterium]|nr:hypothetical protein [Pseudomonadota bacterium]